MKKVNFSTLRHYSVFNADEFRRTGMRITVIGAGATGSKITRSLAKLGIPDCITSYDFDKVEAHNLANQEYRMNQVGWHKVKALRQVIKSDTGHGIAVNQEKVYGSQTMTEIVILQVDKIETRRLIWEKSIRLRHNVKLLIDTRMGVDCGRIYTIDPFAITHIKAYDKSLDGTNIVTDFSPCGSTISVGQTGDIISGLAVWQFINWFARFSQPEGETENSLWNNEIMFSTRPPMMIVREY